MKVKAILVAGGHGSRLYPFTKISQKTLLPLYERPVIDYALGTIRRAGIKNITIISNQFIGQIAKHVGSGLEGEQIHYVLEETPEGVANALNLARPHNENCRLLIYFSDNITTIELSEYVESFRQAETNPGCILLSREEENPNAFGVAEFDEHGNIVDIIEKPESPPSNIAIGGIYLYDEQFWILMDQCEKEMGEKLSITDVNRKYVQNNSAQLLNIGKETWVDCGTPDSLLDASIMARDGKLNPNPYRN
jgi:glucose-1-phosphate thymidylyltransferase